MPAAASAAAVAAVLMVTVPSPHVVLTIQDPSIDESSGLVASVLHRGLVWTHNDGGTAAQVVALDRTGRSRATVTLAGIDPFDPEALAPGVGPDSRPALYLGDIGDNLGQRTDVSVFRFAEPSQLVDQTAAAQWYRFTYPDGPHDAEALLVSPTGRIFIATKGLADAALYRAPSRPVTRDQGMNRLTRVASVPSVVTDGAFLPDGRFVLRTYTAVYVYDRPGHQVAAAELPPQPQGESVAADGDRLLVGSEGVHARVLAVPVPTADELGPGAATPTGRPGEPRRPGRVAADGDDATAFPVTGVLVAGGALALAAGLLVAARRRPRRR